MMGYHRMIHHPKVTRISRVLCTACILFIFCQSGRNEDFRMEQQEDSSFQKKREQMVTEQIEARGVRDRLVLKAMKRVERHRFVPASLVHAAYNDEPLPIGYDQTISQPYIVALMTEAMQLKGGERVLEIGTGSGYQGAVLAELVDTVYTIEIIEPLGRRAESLLRTLNYSNVRCRIGDGYAGWPENAPFDAIIVTAAPPRIPEPLFEQLNEGGRMVIPVGTMFQELLLIRKVNGKMQKKRLIPVRFVPMVGEIQKRKNER